ncbi:glycosyltransferase [Microbacterium sp. ZW T5_45]|uniref:glycosyltransferase n=1 Tax=Microbacterium sp. ZW T5_45 TaxID=3378080 RepID=UPI003852FF32
MKILHVINSADTGGAQTLIEALAVRHRNFGIQTEVVVLLGRDSLSDRLDLAADRVHYLDLKKSPIALMSAWRRFKQLIVSSRPNIVHSHLLQSDLLVALSRSRVPHVSTIHTSGGHESGATSRLVTFLVSRVATRIDRLIACSPSAAAFARRRYRREVDLTVLNGTSLGAAGRDAPGKRPQLLCLSRWHPMKDHRSLLAALSRMGESAPLLVCAGAGMTQENEELSSLLEEFKEVRVELRGPINNVREALSQSSALVISSSHGEALPMAGIEALAAGIPVITTDVGDSQLLAISPDLLVEPKDPLALAAAIRTTLEEDTDWFDAARALAESTFDIDTTAEHYYDIYRDMTGREDH